MKCLSRASFMLGCAALLFAGCDPGSVYGGGDGDALSDEQAGQQGEYGALATTNPSDSVGGLEQACDWDGSCDEGYVCLGVCVQESDVPGTQAGPCFEDETCHKGLECRAGVCASPELLASTYDSMVLEDPEFLLEEVGFLTHQQELTPEDLEGIGQIASARELSTYLPPVGYQGRQGSCVSWAIGYGLASYMFAAQRQIQRPRNNRDLMSPAYLHNQTMNYTDCHSGPTSFGPANNILRDQGIAPLSAFGYSTNRNGCTTRITSEALQAASSNRMRQVLYINKMRQLVSAPAVPTSYVLSNSEFQQIKAQVSRGYPVAVAIRTYEEFMRMNSRNPLQSTMTPRASLAAGHAYHAVLVVGYDDSRQTVKIMNSWANRWGRNGFGEITYDVFRKITGMAYVAAPAQSSGTPAPEPDIPTSTPQAPPSTNFTCTSVTLGRSVPPNTCIQIDAGRGCTWHKCVAHNDYDQISASALSGCDVAYGHATCQDTPDPVRPEPMPDPMPSPTPTGNYRDQLVVTLSWDAEVDLDISAIEPSGTRISHSHSTLSPNDGSRSECNPVRRICNRSASGKFEEHIVWGVSGNGVTGGIYRFYAANYTGGTANFALTIRRYDSRGRIAFERVDRGSSSSRNPGAIIAIDLRN